MYLLVEGELQNDEEHGLAVVAHRISDLLRAVGRTEARGHGRDRGRAPGAGRAAGGAPASAAPATAGPAAGEGLHPRRPHHRRPDAWELPAVEPRTRPGRTG